MSELTIKVADITNMNDLKNLLTKHYQHGATYQIAYVEEPDVFTVPVLLNEQRIERITNDLSITSIKIKN
jgi:hypothetical protein